jgi:hypothetical protein
MTLVQFLLVQGKKIVARVRPAVVKKCCHQQMDRRHNKSAMVPLAIAAIEAARHSRAGRRINRTIRNMPHIDENKDYILCGYCFTLDQWAIAHALERRRH